MSPRRTVLAALLLAAAAGVLMAAGPAQACAVCGHGPGQPDPMGRGYYWGILFMMAMPFSIAGAFGGWLAYLHWRARPGASLRTVGARLWARLRASLLGTMPWIEKESER